MSGDVEKKQINFEVLLEMVKSSPAKFPVKIRVVCVHQVSTRMGDYRQNFHSWAHIFLFDSK